LSKSSDERKKKYSECILLIGDNPMEINVGSTFEDPEVKI